MKKSKLLSLLLALCMVATLLAGCGSKDSGSASGSGGNSQGGTSGGGGSTPSNAGAFADLPDTLDGVVVATPEMYSAIDLSKSYTVNMYLIGDTPNDWDQVLALMNEYLEPFNTVLNVTIMDWSSYQDIYSLNLMSGDVDLIFTAPWCFMYTEAPKGSFYELTDDFISTYMPLADRYQDKESWSETTISGKTIAIPSNQASPMGKIVAIRQDLADKYGISSLSNWDDYMNYMLTIAEKETPSSGILALAASGDNNELWDVYRQQTDTFLALDSDYLDMIYEYKGGIPNKDDIKLSYETDAFRAYAKDMKTMADAGCWSRSAANNSVSDDDAFGALQGASIAWNGSVFTYMKQAEQTAGVECMAYDLTTDHLVGAEAFSNNDMAIAASSSNPERAAMVLDILKFDTYMNRLALLGIEDVHYTIDENGYYTKIEAKTGDYAPLNLSLAWAIKNGNLEESGTPEREKLITDAWQERVQMNPTITFVFDTSSVDSYVSAVKLVLQDYVPMLELGLVDDVDSYLDEMIGKCYDSGLQNIYDEFYAQYDAWAATR